MIAIPTFNSTQLDLTPTPRLIRSLLTSYHPPASSNSPYWKVLPLGAPCGTTHTRAPTVETLSSRNYNILSLPGGTIATVLDFFPPKDKFDTIVLFIGGNNAFNNQTPSTPPPREIARELSHLANRLLELARKVVILGIPFRKGENNHNRARAINIEIENLKSQNSWNFRGIAAKTFKDSYLQPDGVHLTPTEGLQPVRSALKKLLYKEFSKSADSAGHTSDPDCPSDRPCRCSYLTLPRRR